MSRTGSSVKFVTVTLLCNVSPVRPNAEINVRCDGKRLAPEFGERDLGRTEVETTRREEQPARERHRPEPHARSAKPRRPWGTCERPTEGEKNQDREVDPEGPPGGRAKRSETATRGHADPAEVATDAGKGEERSEGCEPRGAGSNAAQQPRTQEKFPFCRRELNAGTAESARFRSR
jgi:hypothetical protein